MSSLLSEENFYNNIESWLRNLLKEINHDIKFEERLEKSLVKFFHSFKDYPIEEILEVLNDKTIKNKIIILKYIANKLLELSSNQAKKRNDKLIKVKDFIKTIVKDEELLNLFNKYWNIKIINQEGKVIIEIGLKFLLDKDMYNKYLKVEGLNYLLIKNFTDNEIRRVFDYLEGDLDDQLTENEKKLLNQLNN